MPLTKFECDSAKPREKAYKLFDGHGLYLEVAPTGSKYWRLKYRIHGKEKRLALGVYSEVSLLKARKEREAARMIIAEGKDPSLMRKERKRVQKFNAENTFEVVARDWHGFSRERWGERYATAILHRMEVDLFPVLGPWPIDSITPPQVLDAIRLIESRGAHEIAQRSLQYAGRVFRHAIHNGRIKSDPTRDLRGALKPYRKGHYKALSSRDLPDFLRALVKNDARLYPQTIRAVRLLMLTFVRTNELIGAQWAEFDLEEAVWNIPAERMKTRVPHIVPLSRQAIALLKDQAEYINEWGWVFPNQARPRDHMSDSTILGAIRRIGFKDKTTGHGFRALAMSTIKEKLHYRHEVVDRQLAHARRNKVDAAYDRAEFLDERAKMMQEWADYVATAENHQTVITHNFLKKTA